MSIFPLSDYGTARDTGAMAQATLWAQSKRWVLGIVSSRHQASAECGVCLAFHGPKDLLFWVFFLLEAACALWYYVLSVHHVSSC